MTYSTLMVHLELGRPNTALLQVAADLAQRAGAAVTGFAAGQLNATGQNRADLERDVAGAEAAFRQALRRHRGALAWRSSISGQALPECIAHEAREAELLLTSVASGDVADATRSVNLADLVMLAKRPVLLVPDTATVPALQRTVVAWKDTSESRRAVVDALPLLKLAAHVAVVEVGAARERDAAVARSEEVVAWLAQHGVPAQPWSTPTAGDEPSGLRAAVKDQRADAIVAGAYGPRRLREWVLGAVTRDLLLRTNCCVLVSH